VWLLFSIYFNFYVQYVKATTFRLTHANVNSETWRGLYFHFSYINAIIPSSLVDQIICLPCLFEQSSVFLFHFQSHGCECIYIGTIKKKKRQKKTSSCLRNTNNQKLETEIFWLNPIVWPKLFP
jgi:hypothetical protein